jgi:hypothetical protein
LEECGDQAPQVLLKGVPEVLLWELLEESQQELRRLQDQMEAAVS